MVITMEGLIKVISVNISAKKGEIKRPVPMVEVVCGGIRGDAHAGSWHRQVSLLAKENIDQFSHTHKRPISSGEFAENITTIGLDLSQVNMLDRFQIGSVLLEVSQIGKACHGTGCEIFQNVGHCIMPKEGIFTRVLQEGKIKAGDSVEYLPVK